jgi:hypothetical protein
MKRETKTQEEGTEKVACMKDLKPSGLRRELYSIRATVIKLHHRKPHYHHQPPPCNELKEDLPEKQ